MGNRNSRRISIEPQKSNKSPQIEFQKQHLSMLRNQEIRLNAIRILSSVVKFDPSIESISSMISRFEEQAAGIDDFQLMRDLFVNLLPKRLQYICAYLPNNLISDQDWVDFCDAIIDSLHPLHEREHHGEMLKNDLVELALKIEESDDCDRIQGNNLIAALTVSNCSCYFSIDHTNLKRANGYRLQCSGKLIRMDEVDEKIELHGAEDCLDLLILRGTGENIDWTNYDSKQRVASSYTCENHVKSLLVNWKSNPVFNKRIRARKNICSLPNVLHDQTRIPVASRRLQKEDALRLMADKGVLIHVGTGICTTHAKSLNENRLHDIMLDDQIYDVNMASGDDEGSEYNASDHASRSSSLVSVHESENESHDLFKKNVQDITHAFGLSRISSDIKWMSMTKAVQEKKINSMIRLIDGVSRVAAGDDWMEFRSRCISKMGLQEPDIRVAEIMQTISFALADCSLRSVRNNILSLVTGIFTEREIIQYTGCTGYDIRQAKLSAKGGMMESKVPFHRVRLNRSILKDFVSFVALPEISMYLPSAGKVHRMESGESIELAKVIRIFSYREIHRRYLRSIEQRAVELKIASEDQIEKFVKNNSIGFSTAHKLMKAALPIRRMRLQCIDNHQADSLEAYEYLNSYANELAALGKIDSSTLSDLLRRSRVSSNFVSYEQRVHMEKESSTINHCLRYLLSDPNDKRFSSPCNRGPRSHTHELVCKECLECIDVFDIFLEILENILKETVDKNGPESIRFKRMIDQLKISKENVLEYRKHQIRSFASEMNRKEIIDSLQPKEALIVLDFALKLIPTTSIEVQSAWYGKAGIAYHMSYCVANLDGELYHHAFGHPADDMKQDSVSVSAITEDVLRQLKDNGVERVFLRSDNGASYHNAAYFFTLYHLSKSMGIQGDADREISHSKRKIRDYVHGKGNVRYACDVVDAVVSGTPLKATSVHEIIVKPIAASKATFSGIASLGAFRFEGSGIRAWKYDQIGEGVFIEERKIVPNKYSYALGKQGGSLSKSDIFWKKFNSDDAKEVKLQEEPNMESTETLKEGIFSCTDRLCHSTFLTLEGLMKHELRGIHNRRKNSESTIDTGLRLFAQVFETDAAASRSVKSDSLVSIVKGEHDLPKQGFAMKNAERAPTISLSA